VPNFVDLQTGSWGHTIVDGLNSWRSTTLATFDTLASLITYTATSASSDWRSRFFSAATPEGGKTPSNTLEAVAGIARQSWAHPKELFALFDEAYPQPKDGSLRAAPFAPYLADEPPDFALMLCFWGGGLEASGRLQFDADGNAWVGNNWIPGAQSNVVNNIPGHVAKLAPDGAPLSPPIIGFTGAGLQGLGWGGAVTLDSVWMPGLNGKILVMNFDDRPIASESDFPFHEKLGGLMGTGVATNGDVWIADGSGDQLLFFPGGRVKEGRIVKAPGLKSPFDVVIDNQNRVWVSNSQSDTVVRFPADDPNSVQTFRVGLSPRGLALDSKNNVWVSSNLSPDIPDMPKVPEGVSIMKQFQMMFQAVVRDLETGRLKSSGFISLLRADGTQPEPNAFNGGGLVSLPWGINIDGNDDVWTTSDSRFGVIYMAGDDTKGHAAGTKTGDVLHLFVNGTLQVLTDVSIDAAGDVWAADNWYDLPIATGLAHDFVKSTWGGGVGVTVIYGVAPPVKPPKMGAVRTY
jgi:hypothetical protein